MGTSRGSTIYLGSFVKAFGIKGELKFVGSDDFWDGALDSGHLELRRLTGDGDVERKRVTVERSRAHGTNFVVKLEGIDDRNGAETEVGGELFLDTGDLDVALPDKELPFQVVGLTVKTEDGRVLGTIRSVVFSAAHPVYDVESEGGDFMIPAIPQFVVGKDLETGEIIIRPIPGLLDG